MNSDGRNSLFLDSDSEFFETRVQDKYYVLVLLVNCRGDMDLTKFSFPTTMLAEDMSRVY